MNRDGVLLEMVQLLTDLDLVISKSYISSDGGWLMDGKDCLLLLFLVNFFLNAMASCDGMYATVLFCTMQCSM